MAKQEKKKGQTIGQILLMGFGKPNRLAYVIRRGDRYFVESEGITVQMSKASLREVLDAVHSGCAD